MQTLQRLQVPWSLFGCAIAACSLLACGAKVDDTSAALPDGGTAAADTGTAADEPAAADPGGQVGEQAPIVALAGLKLGITPTYASYVGQSVLVPAGGPFDHVRFHWYGFDVAPKAFGTLYVLDREYLGKPSALGPSTPGFVGKSEAIAGGQYIFPPAMRLSSGVRYWFYTNTPGDVLTSKATSEDMYPSGEQYLSAGPEASFAKSTVGAPPTSGYFMDATFNLLGRASR